MNFVYSLEQRLRAGFAVFVALTLSLAYARPAPFQLGAHALLRWERRLVQYGSSGLADLAALEEKVRLGLWRSVVPPVLS